MVASPGNLGSLGRTPTEGVWSMKERVHALSGGLITLPPSLPSGSTRYLSRLTVATPS